MTITAFDGTENGKELVDKLNELVTDVNSAVGAAGGVEVEDEGTSLTTAVSVIDFVGDGVTVTEPVADEVTVTIPGESAASDTTAGIVELATTAETTTGTDATRAVTPDGLKDGYQGSANVTTLGTVTTGDVSAIVTESLTIALGDETTDGAVATGVVTFRMPYAFTLTGVRASCTTAPTGSVATIDINEGGTSILSTKLTIDATEKTSTTAATAAVISDSALADDAEITIDIDGVGSTVAGAGYKVTLIGHQ